MAIRTASSMRHHGRTHQEALSRDRCASFGMTVEHTDDMINELGRVVADTCAGTMPGAQRFAEWIENHPDYPTDVPVITNNSGC